jgi:hypothetical protein
MGIQLTCDHCGLLDGGDRGVLYALGFATAEQGSVQVRLYEYPALLHWGCITDHIRRRDAEEQEPPF